jgi:uncharacterized secreted protein with C-terminal beta-propeller domain
MDCSVIINGKEVSLENFISNIKGEDLNEFSKESQEDDYIEDISSELSALFEYAEEVVLGSVDSAIEAKLEMNNFKNVKVDEIQPLDWVEVNGEPIYLNSPKKYYEFKENNTGIVKKLYNKERDLNPTKIT